MDRIEAEKKARRRRITEQIICALDNSGMSRKEFAAKMHRVPSEVTRWLNGNHNFSSDLLAEISVVLGEEIYGSERQIPKMYVEGYEKKSQSAATLNDSAVCPYEYIEIPKSAIDALRSKARMEGMTARDYIMKIISEAAMEAAPAADDFCGLWCDGFPDADEIYAARTHNTYPQI